MENGAISLGEEGARIAARGARAYLDRYGLKPDRAKLLACLKAHCRKQIHIALADAKKALDAGMVQIAETTFTATMQLAGIEAAKEACGYASAKAQKGA